MTNPISLKGYVVVTPDEADEANSAIIKKQNQSLHEITSSAKWAGDRASTLAPHVAAQVVTFLALNYLKIFSVLSYLNWKVATYGVPAIAAVGAEKLAEKIQPVTDAVGSAAGAAARNVTACAQYAMLSSQDRYYGPSFKQVVYAVNA